jgi:tripartite-type tricarboxylate transporter receptor subunit TctC
MRLFIASICMLLLALALPTFAQNYPERPVRVIVVFPPGGSNDVTARIVFKKMSEMTGQQFIIDNRGGAGGTIGSELVAQSPPDGYTIMVQSATHVANPHLYRKLPYDAFKDFVGITALARQVGMLVVHPSLPAGSVKQFIGLAKSRPGEITYGSAGNGTFVHLTMALFAHMAKLDMIHVPYKGGGPSVAALVAGETQAMTATIGSVFPHIAAKRLRPLGVTSETRVEQFPDVPAIAEALPGYEFTAWMGCFAPARTPQAIVEKLNADLVKALKDPEVARALTRQTLDPMPMTPQEFAQRLRADDAKYEKVIKLSGARIG